ncbi:MAG TPA: 1-acyl-sn-glycerol-3-phosphate acyltransferase [Anaerolineae bacterium]|nr:1-acyl-sn-glycerol-3-phosphate acyltransferase [Anaerolineae bacterium]
MTKYRLAQLVFRAIFKLIAKIKVSGLEHFPREGAFILTINHLALIDPVVLLSVVPPRKITVLVAKKWEHTFFVGWLVRSLGGIFIHRGEVDRHALQAALNVLKSGGIIGLAPEGTRSKTGGLQRAKAGVAYLATKANVPVLPIGISGQQGLVKSLLHLRRLKIHVNIGELIYLPPLSGKDKMAQLQAYADEIMIAIAKLIEPELRGVYASAVFNEQWLRET